MGCEFFEGYKTIISCIGLVGLGIYQASQGEFGAAMQSFIAALGLFGLRSAMAKQEEVILRMKEENLQMKMGQCNKKEGK